MERESILKRLQGLAAKTVANGCTEAEALAAAEMLGKLMDRYGFDEAELGRIKKENIDKHLFTERGKVGNLQFVANAVAEFCDVKVWATTTPECGRTLELFGRDPDVLLAKHLLIVFHDAMLSGWWRYKRQNKGAIGPRDKDSFERGMMSRLSARLREMKAARNAFVDEGTGMTGRALVVQRMDAVNAALAETDLKLRNGRRTKRRVNHNAWNAGRSAGDRVNISTGIGAN